MLNLSLNIELLGLAIVSGIIPPLCWLWFWLREDKKHPEPKGLIGLVFIMGMATVAIVLPLEKMIQNFSLPYNWELIAWAASEEVLKFLMVVILVSSTNQADEPTDWPIYLITVALGFAALENVLFLLKPFSLGQAAVGLLTSQLRFLGASLLHTIASGVIGIAIGLSFFMHGFKKIFYVILGLILSVALHSTYNFFIIATGGQKFLQIFSFLWVGAIIVMLVFEKLRRMNLQTNTKATL